MCYGNFLGGLSTAAIILIIVGCVVGVALIGGVLFVLLKPKKKGKGTKNLYNTKYIAVECMHKVTF